MENQSLKINDFKQMVDNADCVLVGIGSELSSQNLLEWVLPEGDISKKEENHFLFESYGIKDWNDIKTNLNNDDLVDLIEIALKKDWFAKHPEKNEPYKKLLSILEDKNYFVISSNTDEGLKLAGFDSTRVVAPFGSDSLFQCSETTCIDIWSSQEYFEDLLTKIPKIIESSLNSSAVEYDKYLPVCPKCGKQAIINVRKDADRYNENGYLDQWALYTAWIQLTLNKKLLIIELGENFSNPKIIRWPFENMVMINNKATFVRINEKFAQIPEEIKEKSVSILKNSIEWLLD